MYNGHTYTFIDLIGATLGLTLSVSCRLLSASEVATYIATIFLPNDLVQV